MKAVILAGGSGTRLWPVSRYGFPKQFIKLDGAASLLRGTVERLLKVCPARDIYAVTNEDYEFHVREELKDVSEELENNIILEPAGRNTAPAIALAVRYFLEKPGFDRRETILVCPSDQVMKPAEGFARYAAQADALARKGFIAVFGVVPRKAETGYGYIKAGAALPGSKSGGDKAFRLARFTEKPDPETAKKFLAAGGYYWNSGMFAFSAGTMVRELKANAPEIGRRLSCSLAEMRSDFRSMPDISLDYAVMERSPKAAVIPLSLTWSDLGSWDSLSEIADKDRDGNIRIGDVIDMGVRNSIFVGGKRLISAVGVRDIIAVDTEDALLLMKRGSAQRVRDVVDLLKSRRRVEVAEHTTAYRPWGNYSVLDEGPRYRIKRIKIKPGGKVSLQRHHHRSEHWVVLKGAARVMIDGKERLLHENESGYVPKSALHRLENPGRVTLELIEVQNGEYVGEDDIIRLDGGLGLPRRRRSRVRAPLKNKKEVKP